MDGKRHYEVVSPSYEVGGIYGQREYTCSYVQVDALTRRAAVAKALKLDEFEPWVTMARADGQPPQKGLAVHLTRCEHGVCWTCGWPVEVQAQYECGFPCRACSDSLTAYADSFFSDEE